MIDDEESMNLTPGIVWDEKQLDVLRDILARAYRAESALRRVVEAADEIHRRGTEEVAAMDDESDEHRKNQCASRAATYARAEHLVRRALDGAA